MTQSPRTIAQITASIDFVVKAITGMKATLQELRNMRGLDHFYVLGFDYGLFLTTRPGYVAKALGGFAFARKFDSARAARLNMVYNGRGEAARVYRHDDALALALREQEHVLDGMQECLVSCQLELDAAYALERAEAEAQDRRDREAEDAQWEMSYLRGLYEDSFIEGINAREDAFNEAELRADIEARSWEEHERKAPRSWTLRGASAIIARSNDEYEG